MQNPFRRAEKKDLSVTPAVQTAIEQGTANFSSQLGTPLGKLAQNNIREAYLLYENAQLGYIYQSVPAVRTCVDFLARQIMQLNFELYGTNSDGEREDIDDHPAAELLCYPNEWTPGKQWMQAMTSDLLVYGNAYSLKIRGTNGNWQTFWIPAWKVQPYGQSIFINEGFKVLGERGAFTYVEPNNMIHWQDYNPTDLRRGYSKVETLRKVIQEDTTMQQTNLELMKSGLTGLGNAFLTRPIDAPEWEDGDRERFQAFLAAAMKDSSNVFPVIEDGMRVVQPDLSPQKAQMLEQRKYILEKCAQVFGIPIGLLDGSIGDIEAQTANLYQDVLPPLCDQIQSFMNLHVLKIEYPTEDLWYEFDLKSKLRGDNQARLAQLVSVSGGPILTRNEARGMEGLEALDDPEADELITPLNVTVGGKPSPHVMPVQDPNGPPQDGSHRSEVPVPEEPSEDPPAKSASVETKASELEVKAITLARRANQERRRDNYASDYEGVFSRHFSRQQKTMQSKAAESADAASERWNEELASDLLTAFNRQVGHEGDVAATRLGLAGFDMGQVKHYLEAKAQNIAQNVNEATVANLQAKEATTADVFDVARSERAVNLGMTISTQLSGFSHTEAAKQDPTVSQRMKTWYVTSAKSRHPELDGETVPLFNEFSNGEQMPGDGGDINETAGCQCLVEVG
jgi:HK97 family phage portal protein